MIELIARLFARLAGRDLPPKEVPVPPNLPVLRHGDTGDNVRLVQSILASQGFFHGELGGNFLGQTSAAVIHFQQTHIGPDRKPLEDDGVVGEDTWWALFNPSGPAQRQNIKPVSPVLTPTREERAVSATLARSAVLAICAALHKEGVREIPDGSNTGDGVTRFHKWYGMAPAAWCMMAATWCYHQGTGYLPLGKKMARVALFVEEAKRQKKFHAIGSGYIPRPGDFLVIVNPDGTGHVGILAALERLSEWADADVYEGNSGNRFALRRRTPGRGNHIGWVNPYGDDANPPDFKPGLGKSTIAPANTR